MDDLRIARDANPMPGAATEGPEAAPWSFLGMAFALLAMALVGMTGVISFSSFDPPGWLRVAVVLSMPVSWLLALGFSIMGVGRSHTKLAVAAIAVCVVDAAGFVAMLAFGS